MEGLRNTEFEALQVIALPRKWSDPIESPYFGVWEMERLDQRGWLFIAMVPEGELANARAELGACCGFASLMGRRYNGSGLDTPTWSDVVRYHRFHCRFSGSQRQPPFQVVLSSKGRAAFGHLTRECIVTPSPSIEMAESIERMVAEYRVIRHGNAGFKIELLLSDHGQDCRTLVNASCEAELHRLFSDINERLLPLVQPHIDDLLRLELKSFIPSLNPPIPIRLGWRLDARQVQRVLQALREVQKSRSQDPKIWLDSGTVAGLVGKSTSHISALARKGTIDAEKQDGKGRYWMIDAESAANYFKTDAGPLNERIEAERKKGPDR
jgi:hypothetical protein